MSSQQEPASGSAHGDAAREASESSTDDQGPCRDRFWSAQFSVASRKLLMLTLCACFAIQTYLVYSDSTPQPRPLAGKALEGRRIWHEYNCQSCHQFYGFGGFLGPDLTNVGPRLTRPHLELMLSGYGAMPAFDLPSDQIDALEAFLRAMNDTGVGQARAGSGLAPGLTLERIVGQHLPDDDSVRAGFEVSKSLICNTCHVPFDTAATGAPDLSTAFTRAGPDTIAHVLKNGRGAMPAFTNISKDQIEQVVAFLQWMESDRGNLKAMFDAQMPDSVEWSKLPWWEYR